jgi:hypothetical protein
MCLLAAVLSATGGLFELAGLGLVVVGIARDRDQARRLFVAKRRTQRPRRTYPPKAMPRSYPGYPGPFASGGSGDLRKLAEYISKVDAAAYNNFIDMRKALDAELDRSMEDLQQELTDADNELRGHLRYVLAGSISDRVQGAILLGAGIVLGTTGSILGNAFG